MKNKLVLAAVLALSGAGAFAQNVPTYNAGDLLIGFQETGAANNLVIDIGNIGNFTSNVDLGNVDAALTADFGGVSGVSWSVAGALNGANAGASTVIDGVTYLPRTFWLTQQQTTGAGIQGSSVVGTDFNTASVVNGPVTTLGVNLQGTPALAASGLLLGASNVSAAGPASYTTLENTGGNNYGLNNALSNALIEQTGAGSADLYVFASTTPGSINGKKQTLQSNLLPSYLGTFDLSGTGELTFTTASAVPEPSTYAAILGAMTLGFVALRRRLLSA